MTKPKHRKKKGVKELLETYGDTYGVAVEITRRIKERNLNLPEIRYFNRRDQSSGKMREIGVESAMQQAMNYVAVYALMPMLQAKIVPHQYASIPKRGQVKGKKMLEKWIQRDKAGSKYHDKMDVYHCFESIQHDVVRAELEHDIGKNKTIIWFVCALIATYKKGLSIGSFLSQWLCNYIMSKVYHFASGLHKIRRGKRVRLITHIIIYMDDMTLFSDDKRNLKMAVKKILDFMRDRLKLTIKPNHHIKQTDLEAVDMMGYVIARNKTTIRARVFIRARRGLLRAWERLQTGQPIYLQNARSIMSRKGYFMHTDSYKVSEELHLYEVCAACKKIISMHDRRVSVERNSILSGTTRPAALYVA